MKKIVLPFIVALTMAFPVCAAENEVTPYLLADSPEYATIQAANMQLEDSEKNMLVLDMDTIMPMYQADLEDFLETGTLTVERKQLDGYDAYTALVRTPNGNFAGEVDFAIKDNGQTYSVATRDSVTETLDFATHEEKIRQSLTEKAGNTDIDSIKVFWFEGIGYALLTETADQKQYVTTIGAQQANSPLLPEGTTELPGVDNAAETIATYTPKEIKKAAGEPSVLPVAIGSAVGGLVVGAGATAFVLRRKTTAEK